MPNKLYEEASVQAIANAIRAKNGTTTKYKIAEMAGAVQGITGAENVEWHQCPEAVRNYLANVTYNPDDYSTSEIATYAPAIAVVSNYKPIGKTVGGVTYYNEAPNKLTPFAGGSAAGTLKPLDALRWLNTPQAKNVRDLGGWACDGGTVRYGLLIRGGEVTSADRDVLVGECGVHHDLNLRGAEEANRTVSPLGNDVWFYCPTNFVWYSLADKATWKEILLYVIEAVTHNEPVYFHCASGADRTGTVACLLEAILGMGQSDIDKDYELTCFATGTETDVEARRRNETDWKSLISQIEQYTGDTFRDKAVSFATSCGIPASKLDAFRAAMSTGTPGALPGDTHSVTYALNHVTSSNPATTVEDQAAYTTTLSADNDYTIQSVSITMGGVDVSSYYANGLITIPNVTGDVVITAIAVASVYTDIELYKTDGAALNKKFSGTSIVDGNGNYITVEVPVNMQKYRYIKVSGAHMSGYDGTVDQDNAIFYKLAFMHNGTVQTAQYTNNLALSSDVSAKAWNIDMSKYANYQQCDALRMQILVSASGAAVTADSVVPTSVLTAACSTTL